MRMSTRLILVSILAVILCFFVISLCLASAHSQTIVAEWQSWFGIVEEIVPEVQEPVETVVTTMIN